MNQSMSRRSFMTGMAGASATVAAAAVAGSSQARATETADGLTYDAMVAWDGEYDVVVVGFGGAGAMAAKAAAEKGASVLLLEKAPEGLEGGNTRFCGQLFAYGNENYEDTKRYLEALNDKNTVPEAMLEVFAQNIAHMVDVIESETGLPREEYRDCTQEANIGAYLGGGSPEYAELPGSESVQMWITHETYGDGYLWEAMRAKVVENADKIDVWFSSPATGLVQDPVSKTIVGVRVNRDGQEVAIHAKNGVVLTCGGFASNQQMVETYLGIPVNMVAGTEFNEGDGVRMAIEAGADLWHMDVYETQGDVPFPLTQPGKVYGPLIHRTCKNGQVMLVSGAGGRFVNVTEVSRHGHFDVAGGMYYNPIWPSTMYYVMSEDKYNETLEKGGVDPEYPYTYRADTWDELAEMTGMQPDLLKQTVEEFNDCAANGTPDRLRRPNDSMEAFPEEGPYYAVYVVPIILNTQGGARRNEKAEVLDTQGNPIPRLYSAGEFGSITSLQYQGGCNVSECFVFGRIAGENAAEPKETAPYVIPAPQEPNLQFVPGAVSDIQA